MDEALHELYEYLDYSDTNEFQDFMPTPYSATKTQHAKVDESRQNIDDDSTNSPNDERRKAMGPRVKDVPVFSSFIHHNNKQALLAKLHEILTPQSKGKEIAIVIEALRGLSYICGYKSREELFSGVRAEFGINASSQGINYHLNLDRIKLLNEDITATRNILLEVNP